MLTINYKRASLACAGWRTFCVAGGALWVPRFTLINDKVDNISKYVCLTFIIDIT